MSARTFQHGIYGVVSVWAWLCSGQSEAPLKPAHTDLGEARQIAGCLYSTPKKHFYLWNLNNTPAQYLLLGGNTTVLQSLVGSEVRVTGMQLHTDDTEFANDGAGLQVKTVTLVARSPRPKMPSIPQVQQWRVYASGKYGLRTRYPKEFGSPGHFGLGLNPGQTDVSNFTSGAESVTLLSLEIPPSIYEGSIFSDGAFGISVSRKIKDRATCAQFRYRDRNEEAHIQSGSIHQSSVAGVTYSESDLDFVGLSGPQGSYLHTFQNGLCYEFAFETNVKEHLGMMPLPCLDRLFARDFLLRSLLSQVAFVKPRFNGSY
jgi:hypothetical protein